MKKLSFLLIITVIAMLVVACNKPQKSTPEPPEPTVDIEEVIEDDEVADDEEEVVEESTDEEDEVATNESENGTNDESNDAQQIQNDLWKKPNKIENMNHLDIVHLAYDIFAAQDRKDYGFLESIAAKGTTVDRKNNKFKFENVTYPFEMEFFTKEELGTLEFRYTHEEDGVIIVGFGAINYKEESSFVVDFEFVKEDGKWKMRSMDINK